MLLCFAGELVTVLSFNLVLAESLVSSCGILASALRLEGCASLAMREKRARSTAVNVGTAPFFFLASSNNDSGKT